MCATLLGDLIGSRAAADRAALHRRLRGALDAASARVPPLTRLAVTAGDEFQGTYERLGQAITAARLIRFALLPDSDVRCGIGWGEVTDLDDQGTQDGPGWWSAREAIEQCERDQQRSGTRHLRTVYHLGASDGADPRAVNAALVCRDHLLGSMDGRSQRILEGLMSGRSGAEVAAAEGISPSAVSQRVARDGLEVLRLADRWLEQLP